MSGLEATTLALTLHQLKLKAWIACLAPYRHQEPSEHIPFFLFHKRHVFPALPSSTVSHLRYNRNCHDPERTITCPSSLFNLLLIFFYSLLNPHTHSTFFSSAPVPSYSPISRTMADNSAHRLDLRVGGKYRLGKKIGSGSFGQFATSSYPPFLTRFKQVTSTSESTSSPVKKSPSNSSP